MPSNTQLPSPPQTKNLQKMGELNPSPSFPQDLKFTILSSSTLHPSEPTEKRSMFLSNIDQVLNFNVETIHFFPANKDYPVDKVIETLPSVLERLLVPYDFLAGRLRYDEKEGRLEIDCNAAGVGFVVASSELELAELGELEYPNPAFLQLAPVPKRTDGLALEEQPLVGFQVTSFKCGGFALGISNDHSTFDGLSFQIFLKNLASLTFNKPLAIPPYNNHRLLAARSPPSITFSHPELVKLEEEDEQPLNPPSNIIDTAAADELEFKLFHLTTNHISSLKEMAKMDCGDGLGRPTIITSFNVVVAHLWRCKALATNGPDEKNKTSTVIYAVDIRQRLDPTLPPSYTGNAVLSAYATATCQDLEEGPFSRIVELVREGAVRMSDEYIRSVIDWGQVHKGFPRGDVFVSSWWKLGFAEVVYPWGKPSYSCPVVHPKRDIILLFPHIGGVDKGVNALIALPSEDMKKFHGLFYKALE